MAEHSRYNFDRLLHIPGNLVTTPFPSTGKSRALPMKSDNPLSVIQEEDVTYENTSHFVFISSSYRDDVNYPLHYDYRVELQNEYKNVKSVEMISATIPNITGILDEPVVVFDIDELNFIDFPSKSGNSHKGFTIIPLKSPNKTTDGFINPELSCTYRGVFEHKTPIASLNHLRIKIRDVDGNLYDFGAPAGSTAKKDQHSFVLKIVTQEKSRDNLNYRNVF